MFLEIVSCISIVESPDDGHLLMNQRCMQLQIPEVIIINQKNQYHLHKSKLACTRRTVHVHDLSILFITVQGCDCHGVACCLIFFGIGISIENFIARKSVG